MNWKDIVKNIAPLLGTALGGPMGGMATKWLAGELLGDENASEESLEEAILQANPDKLVEIKALEVSFKLKMKELGIKEKQLELEDKQDARDLFSVDKRPQIILSGVFVTGYFILVYSLITGIAIIPEEQKTLVNTLMGVLTAGVANIMQFWFGSSSGSKDKDSSN